MGSPADLVASLTGPIFHSEITARHMCGRLSGVAARSTSCETGGGHTRCAYVAAIGPFVVRRCHTLPTDPANLARSIVCAFMAEFVGCVGLRRLVPAAP